MDDSMVDRVARAIAAAQTVAMAQSVSGPRELKAHYVGIARAAIAAMREPTAAMIKAEAAAFYDDPLFIEEDDDSTRPRFSVITWKRMIDAALA